MFLKKGLSKAGTKILESPFVEAFPRTNSKAVDVKMCNAVLVEEYLSRNIVCSSGILEIEVCRAAFLYLHFYFFSLLTDEVLSNEIGL